jgi:hypothetical protein
MDESLHPFDQVASFLRGLLVAGILTAFIIAFFPVAVPLAIAGGVFYYFYKKNQKLSLLPLEKAIAENDDEEAFERLLENWARDVDLLPERLVLISLETARILLEANNEDENEIEFWGIDLDASFERAEQHVAAQLLTEAINLSHRGMDTQPLLDLAIGFVAATENDECRFDLLVYLLVATISNLLSARAVLAEANHV